MKPLNPTYDRVIREINRQNKDVIDLALRVFSWLLKARRVLTVEEIKIAVSVQPGRYELDELDLPDRPTLLEVCGGLVTIDEDTDTVRFAHYTVQEYLVEKSIAIDTGPNIAVVCGTYLCFDKLGMVHSIRPYRRWPYRHINKTVAKEVYRSNPFLAYAAVYFRDHLHDCNEDQSAECILKLIQDRKLAGVMIQCHIELCGPKSDYYSPEFRDSWSHQYLFSNIDLSLHLAWSFGNRIALRKLIDSGYNIFHAQPTAGYTFSPLHYAARFGHVELMQFLLETGADIKSVNWYRDTVLHWAISSNSERTIQILIDNGVDINAANKEGKTALDLAVIYKKEISVRTLMKHVQ
jgi:hypothetical protein